MKLKSMVNEELQNYESEIKLKYHEGFNASILMDDFLTQEKNKILRKIKLMRMKNTNLPDFKRKRTEEILLQRQIDEKKLQESNNTLSRQFVVHTEIPPKSTGLKSGSTSPLLDSKNQTGIPKDDF